MNIFEDIASTNEEFQRYQRAWRLRSARANPSPTTGCIEECRMLRQYLDPKRIAEERDLDGKAWFAYGYLTPMQRNELYTQEYVAAFRDLFPTLSGHPSKAPYNPVNSDFVRNTPDIMSALNRGRQCADAVGLPYRIYCRAVMRALMMKQRHHNMPRPNQLAGDEAVTLAMQKQEELLRSLDRDDHFGGDTDPRLRADRYRGDPVQISALDALERQVSNAQRGYGRVLLGQYLRDGFISEQEARDRFGDTKVDRVLAEHGPARFSVNGGAAMQPHKPPCFGLALASVPKCDACPVREQCAQIIEVVNRKQVMLTGSVDPRHDHIRAGNRKRKRKERYFKSDRGQAALEAAKLELCTSIPKLRGVFYPKGKPELKP
jgi:hypothetical protein